MESRFIHRPKAWTLAAAGLAAGLGLWAGLSVPDVVSAQRPGAPTPLPTATPVPLGPQFCGVTDDGGIVRLQLSFDRRQVLWMEIHTTGHVSMSTRERCGGIPAPISFAPETAGQFIFRCDLEREDCRSVYRPWQQTPTPRPSATPWPTPRSPAPGSTPVVKPTQPPREPQPPRPEPPAPPPEPPPPEPPGCPRPPCLARDSSASVEGIAALLDQAPASEPRFAPDQIRTPTPRVTPRSTAGPTAVRICRQVEIKDVSITGRFLSPDYAEGSFEFLIDRFNAGGYAGQGRVSGRWQAWHPAVAPCP